jgi:hypothetical protein
MKQFVVKTTSSYYLLSQHSSELSCVALVQALSFLLDLQDAFTEKGVVAFGLLDSSSISTIAHVTSLSAFVHIFLIFSSSLLCRCPRSEVNLPIPMQDLLLLLLILHRKPGESFSTDSLPRSGPKPRGHQIEMT